jgi:hypothetical protein
MAEAVLTLSEALDRAKAKGAACQIQWIDAQGTNTQ